MQGKYSISTGYSIDTDKYDAVIFFGSKEIAKLYLEEPSRRIMIEFNAEFTPEQAYHLSDLVEVIKEAEKTFLEYLKGEVD